MPTSSDTSLAMHSDERFIALSVPTKEADFPGLGDAGDIIALLKKKAASGVEQKGRGNLTHTGAFTK